MITIKVNTMSSQTPRFKSLRSETFCTRNLYLTKPIRFCSTLSQCIKSVLRRACVEKRLTVGLLPAIQYLSSNSNGALFCLTAEALPGDSATHMQEVLLQAFCVENGIYVIKVSVFTII